MFNIFLTSFSNLLIKKLHSHNTSGSQQYLLNVPKTNTQAFGSNSIEIKLINDWIKMIHKIHFSPETCKKHPHYLKLVSAIFYEIFILQPFKNYEKCFLFHLKSSFCSQDIPIFLFLSSPLFLPSSRSHCFRGWSKINLKVYDVINCLNKNLITKL